MQNRFKNIKLIKGNPEQHFGAIYSAEDLQTNQKIIIKKVDKHNLKGLESLNRELTFQIDAKGFPKKVDYFEDSDSCYLVTSFIEGTTLDQYWISITRKNKMAELKKIIACRISYK